MKNLNSKVLFGFFIIALVTLTFELLISRVMSVVAWYHFAFMAICLALFGMTIGAVIVHRYKEELFKEFHRSLYLFSLLFFITLLINLFAVCNLSAFTNLSSGEWEIVYHPFNIFLIFTSIALPFISSGVIISMVLSKYALHANKVYFIDLCGASLGCLLFIPIINFLEVINSYFALALLSLLAAFLFNLDDKYSRKKILLLLTLAVGFFLWNNNQSNLIQLRWAKGHSNQAFYKKWNSFSYIRLMDWGVGIPSGWGFAPKKAEEIASAPVKQLYLDIDAAAGTVMANFEDRDLTKIDFLKYDITALAYYLVHKGDTLVIGIGAGRDILTGILFDEKSITGVEINETILDIHRRLLQKFSGNLSQHPKVSFINNEARSYINSSNRTFDLIQLSLIDTFAATQAGAYALTENNLYTIDALKAYWSHLSDKGILSVSYWMHPGSPEFILKLTGGATKALSSMGVDNPRAHLAIVHKDALDNGRGVSNILVKKTAFTKEEIIFIQKYCDEMGFHFILSPYTAAHESFAKMSDPKTIDDYVHNYKTNIAPASDDKPFFFLVTKLNILRFFNEFKFFNFNAEYILFSLLLLMLIATGIFVIFPLIKTIGAAQTNISIPAFSIYFTAIGLGFMFIEMSQLTRLSSFLGHPIYSLSIVLFSFLLSSGLGSFFIGQTDERKKIITYSFIFMSICLLAIIFTIPALEYFSKYPIHLRMLIAVLMVFPLGFFMGSFLPQGMRILEQHQGPVALFWGLNGATSVLGSILAMIFQISFGLNFTFTLGAALYVVAILTLLKLKFSNVKA